MVICHYHRLILFIFILIWNGVWLQNMVNIVYFFLFIFLIIYNVNTIFLFHIISSMTSAGGSVQWLFKLVDLTVDVGHRRRLITVQPQPSEAPTEIGALRLRRPSWAWRVDPRRVPGWEHPVCFRLRGWWRRHGRTFVRLSVFCTSGACWRRWWTVGTSVLEMLGYGEMMRKRKLLVGKAGTYSDHSMKDAPVPLEFPRPWCDCDNPTHIIKSTHPAPPPRRTTRAWYPCRRISHSHRFFLHCWTQNDD